MGDAPPHEGEGVGRIRKTLLLMVFRRLLLSLPKKKKTNLVILVVFLVAVGLWGDVWVMLHPRRATR